MNNLFKLLFTFLFIFTHNHSLSGQDIPPPVLEWEGIQPKWIYISGDTTYVKSTLDIVSPTYGKKYIANHMRSNEDLYILEGTLSPSTDPGPDGCLLHKLDLKTGIPKWIYYYGLYDSSTHRESYLQGDLRFKSEKDEIEITGFKAFDPRGQLSIFGFYGYPIVRKLDAETGNLKDMVSVSDTSIREYIFGYLKNYPFGEDDFLYVLPGGLIDNDSLKASVRFLPSDAVGNSITSSYSSFIKSTGLKTKLYDFLGIIIQRLNENTFLSLIQVRDPARFYTTLLSAELNWHQVAPDLKTTTSKTLNVLPFYHDPLDEESEIIMETKSNQIFLHRILAIESVDENPGKNMWFLWLDENGNEQANIRKFEIEDRKYFYLNVLGVRDDKVYILAHSESNKLRTMDVIEITKGTNQYRLIETLRVQLKGDQRLKLQQYAWLDDILFLGCRLEDWMPNGRIDSYHYYYGFDTTALGLVSRVDELLTATNVIKVFPNPTAEHISFVLPEQKEDLTDYKIFDSEGSLVKSGKIFDQNSTISVQHLTTGIYIVVVEDKSGLRYKSKFSKL
ncbi:MAG: T9SS type A sorting domain-containing protein [Saprospiraceae bacterium]|nr:T9SS type A sorting domain-containing protein [Saprospiraceae bacterium]